MKNKHNKAKVSVLIANYNNAKYINKCINSVLKQTYKNVEIIFIDDRSNDNSLEKVKLFKKRITIIKKKTKKFNIGSFDQMQSFKECFKFSKGDIIFLLDSDDYFHKKKISNIVKKFNKENLSVICDRPILKFHNYQIKTTKQKKFFNNYWPYLSPTSCISFKREEFKKILNIISIKSFPDVWLDFRLSIVSIYIIKNFRIINESLTFYRQTNSNVSSKFKFLSLNWWKRRSQAHDFVRFVLKKFKIQHIKNFDYFLTKLINHFIK